jgi:hypothetical protein
MDDHVSGGGRPSATMRSLLSQSACVVALLAMHHGLQRPAPAMQLTAPTVRDLVAQIQRADYEGDRAALARLRNALSVFVDDPAFAVRVH